MADEQIHNEIEKLVAEEHELWQQESVGKRGRRGATAARERQGLPRPVLGLAAPATRAPRVRSRLERGHRSAAGDRRTIRAMTEVELNKSAPGSAELGARLEQHRTELTAYAYRMLGSSFEAEDAVQETLIRAWRGYERFEGRAALRSWLYRIATNVCLDMLSGRERRARPMDLGPAREPIESNLNTLPEVTWIEPMPDGLVVPEGDPAEVAVARETIRLAFVAALQHLPPRQRAVLILCEVLRWQAERGRGAPRDERPVGEQRAPARARDARRRQGRRGERFAAARRRGARAARRATSAAFEAYDMDALTTLIPEDATQSMPPFDLWLRGRDDILTWWFGPGLGCRGSRLVPTVAANGSPAYGQYKPSDRRRLRAVGAAGDRDRGRPDRRAHVLPRHEDAVPALRAARPTRGVAGSAGESLDAGKHRDPGARVRRPRPGDRLALPGVRLHGALARRQPPRTACRRRRRGRGDRAVGRRLAT